MTIKFERDLKREEHGRLYTPEKWRGPNFVDELNPPATLAGYFRVEDGAPPAPADPTRHKSADDDFPGQNEVWSDGRLRSLSYEEDDEGFLQIEKTLDYETQCETADVWPVVLEFCGGDQERAADLVRSATDCMLASARQQAEAHHYESIEGDYELFSAFEADWLRSQGEQPYRWTRMGLTGLAGFLKRLEDDDPDLESIHELDLAPGTVSEAHEFMAAVNALQDGGPTLADFYC
jgi:hypothetical protein